MSLAGDAGVRELWIAAERLPELVAVHPSAVLAPAERYDGQLSLFGQMTKGDESLQAIEAIPTTGQNDIPYFRPLKPIVLRSVTIRREAAGSPSGKP